MLTTHLRAREHDQLDDARRERPDRLPRREGVGESVARTLADVARAFLLRLGRVRRLVDEMATADTGTSVPSLRNYPLAPSTRRPHRAVGDR